VLRLTGGDEEGAATAFRASADKGDAEALYNLGRMHEHRHERAAALAAYAQAADAGVVLAHAARSRMLFESGADASELKAACAHAQAAAEGGDADSQWTLVALLRDGRRGCARDAAAARRWLEAAARNGHPAALDQLRAELPE
jgi:TPR repeat protein